jgi:predicted ferric reductase
LPREATPADAVWGGVGVAAGILIALALTGNLPIAADAVSAGLARMGQWLGAPPEAGARVYWHMARSAGMVAYLSLWGSVLWGLMVTNKVLDGAVKPLITFEMHQFLSILALAFSGFHAFILLGDRYIRFGLAELLIPFRSPYEPLWVGLGVLSMYLVAVLVVSFYVRRRIGHRAWRLLHYASFFGWVMATLHGLLSGSDSGTLVMQAIYFAATASVGFLLTYRILVTGRRPQRA